MQTILSVQFVIKSSSKKEQDPIRIQGFDDQKLKKKNTTEKLSYLILIKNCNLLMSKLYEKPLALQREHLKKLNFLTFYTLKLLTSFD